MRQEIQIPGGILMTEDPRIRLVLLERKRRKDQLGPPDPKVLKEIKTIKV